jgi:hypothetical protein
MDVISPRGEVELRKRMVSGNEVGSARILTVIPFRYSVRSEVVRAVTYSQPFGYVLTRAILYVSLSLLMLRGPESKADHYFCLLTKEFTTYCVEPPSHPEHSI